MKKFKRFAALVICMVMLLTLNTSVFGAVLDTVESSETVSGYRMGAFRVIDSAFTWKGMSHTHMIMTTAVRISDNRGYTGFCLNAGKYWGENSSISISSDSQLDPADAKNKEIIKAVNYWYQNIFTDNGSMIDASKITPAIALKYAIIQCYIWGIIEDGSFTSKDTAIQVTEIAATLGGKNFGSSYYGYTNQSEDTVLAEARTLITSIKAHNPTTYADVLVSQSSGNQDAAFIISDRRMEEYGDILLYKTDKYDSPLQYITFSVYSDRTCTQHVATGTTDADGEVMFKNLVANKTYYVREVGVGPNGVVLSDMIYPVTVIANTTTGAGSGKIVNENWEGSVEVTKQDEKGVKLSGAEFTVYAWSGSDYSNKVGTLTESGTGVYTISGLTWIPTNQGRFKVVETKAPEGYYPDFSESFILTADNQKFTFTATNEEISLKVVKKDASSEDIFLAGAEFTLYEWNGSSYNTTAYGMLTDNGDGSYEYNGLRYTATNNGKYKLVETKSPAGYCGSWTEEIQIFENNIVIEMQAYNQSTKVQISKKSITTQEELPGATLQIINKSGEVVEEWISGTEPHYIEAKLIAGATYTLREIIAPDGYMVANDIEFTVNSDGTLNEVVMFDEAEPEATEPTILVTPEPEEPTITVTPEPDGPTFFVTPESEKPNMPATPADPDTPATGDVNVFVSVVIAVFALTAVFILRRIY